MISWFISYPLYSALLWTGTPRLAIKAIKALRIPCGLILWVLWARTVLPRFVLMVLMVTSLWRRIGVMSLAFISPFPQINNLAFASEYNKAPYPVLDLVCTRGVRDIRASLYAGLGTNGTGMLVTISSGVRPQRIPILQKFVSTRKPVGVFSGKTPKWSRLSILSKLQYYISIKFAHPPLRCSGSLPSSPITLSPGQITFFEDISATTKQ